MLPFFYPVRARAILSGAAVALTSTLTAHAAVPAADLRGVWEGEIGEQMIMACLDGTQTSAFYYLRDQLETALEPAPDGWNEIVAGAARAHWQLQSPGDNDFVREVVRTELASGKQATIHLHRYDSNEEATGPCARNFYKAQLQAPPDVSAIPALRAAAGFAPQRIAAGNHHSAVVGADGRLWLWGDNTWGQLGDGSKLPRQRPVLIGTGFAQVFAAGDKTVAIKTDGALWSWMQVRNIRPGGYHFRMMPMKVGMGFVHAAVTRNGPGMVAVGREGSLWAEYRPRGGAGDPVLTKIGDGFVRAALHTTGSGTDYVAALKADGTLLAWAYSPLLPIDAPLNLQRETPVTIGTGFSDLDTAFSTVIGRKRDHSFWTWQAEGAWQTDQGAPRLLTVTAPTQLNLPGKTYATVIPAMRQT
ncbi:MAG TPA: hypothetical protein VGC21_15795, partial [Telluria sp.]